MAPRYYRGSESSRETIEFDIKKSGRYVTTCAVNVDLLICGVKLFPCGDGSDTKLTPAQRLYLLEMVQAERKKITDSYPVKTYEGWQESGIPTFEDYCFPGDTVDEAMIEHFVNSVPPVLSLSFCTQGGEPFSSEGDERGACRPTYITFHDLGGGRWQFDGYCFYKENQNRVVRPSRLEEKIAEARKELDGGKRNRAVYGKDEAGEMKLLKRGIGDEEAKTIADNYWRETGRTATIVATED